MTASVSFSCRKVKHRGQKGQHSVPAQLVSRAVANVYQRHDDENEGEVDTAGDGNDEQHLVCAVAHVVAVESSRVGRRLVPLLRWACRRGAGVHQRLLFPAMLPMMSDRMIHFIVSIMSYRLQTSLHHVDAETTAKGTKILTRDLGWD